MGKHNYDCDEPRGFDQKRKKKNAAIDFILSDISPKTENQIKTFEAYGSGCNLLLHGAAGSGKSFLSCFLGIRDVLNQEYKRIVIVRSIVPTRDIGFLPGTLMEKMQVYETPYKELFSELFHRGDAYDILKKKGLIHFTSTSFVRGITMDDSLIIIDEFQNMTMHEISSILTRVGKDSRVILSGDTHQSDIDGNYRREKSCCSELFDIIKAMPSFATIRFELQDIVRSGFVREFLIAKTKLAIE